MLGRVSAPRPAAMAAYNILVAASRSGYRLLITHRTAWPPFHTILEGERWPLVLGEASLAEVD